ncbi:MAG: hypothetical protein LBP58_09100 [Azoarcus sp.]|jgi:hypothetical protein|nr:hypothetical protein [Azoarcus sp.]
MGSDTVHAIGLAQQREQQYHINQRRMIGDNKQTLPVQPFGMADFMADRAAEHHEPREPTQAAMDKRADATRAHWKKEAGTAERTGKAPKCRTVRKPQSKIRWRQCAKDDPALSKKLFQVEPERTVEPSLGNRLVDDVLKIEKVRRIPCLANGRHTQCSNERKNKQAFFTMVPLFKS